MAWSFDAVRKCPPAAPQVEAIHRLALDQTRQHRHLGQQRPDVAKDHTRLPSITRDDQYRRAFAGREVRPVVLEGRQEHRTKRQDEAGRSQSPRRLVIRE